MKMNKKVLGLFGLALASLFLSDSAIAASATGNLTVTATVTNVCTITPGVLAFGNYDPTTATATVATASIVVLCTAGNPYTVGLGAGAGVGGTLTTRKMTVAAGTTTLNYNIFSDAGRTTNWDTTNTVPGTGTGLPQVLTAYGKIPAQQAASAGAYTDSVVATINY